MYKAKTHFLWYRSGEVISDKESQDNVEYWLSQGLIIAIEESKPEPKIESKPEIKDRLAEIKADLEDDGKLNYSNNPAKKSPGRKKK